MAELIDMAILGRAMSDQLSDDPAPAAAGRGEQTCEPPGEAAAVFDVPDPYRQRELRRELVLRALI
jgi:hypothetical protein